ncbi:MAG: hypothetical protein VR73_03365 [Gammaproteobacteria bacterium BRH_c0]|nr:MAG: hypothetical protein VR73_03365 [Gammaproteobacteria bacterium BRH_c0]
MLPVGLRILGNFSMEVARLRVVDEQERGEPYINPERMVECPFLIISTASKIKESAVLENTLFFENIFLMVINKAQIRGKLFRCFN